MVAVVIFILGLDFITAKFIHQAMNAQSDARTSLYYEVDLMRCNMLRDNLGQMTDLAESYLEMGEKTNWEYPGASSVHEDVDNMIAYLERMNFVKNKIGQDNETVRFGDRILSANRELQLLCEEVANDRIEKKAALARATKIVKDPLFQSARY